MKINSIKTESGRGITGTLKDIEGEVKVGNLKWLQNNGVKITDATRKIVDSEDIKKYTII